MTIQALVPVGSKTTMKIGGQARWYAEVKTKAELEEIASFAREKKVSLVPLGGGSNTIFADGVIEAVVCRITANKLTTDHLPLITVEAGAYLATVIVQLAKEGLDLSALTGIPGSVGGAVFGNAGQGHGGIWMDSYVTEVEYYDDGWKRKKKEECDFRYRESWFKDQTENRMSNAEYRTPPIIWAVTLEVPRGDPAPINAAIERLLKKRIETQPHVKTAGSCFKSLPDGTPAWKLIDAAGLRGLTVGGIQIAEKHANFLLNTGGGTLEDVRAITSRVKAAVPQIAGVEMRLIGNDGHTVK